MIAFFRNLARAHQQDEDARRQEYILNVLILGTLGFAGGTLGIGVLTSLQRGAEYAMSHLPAQVIFFTIFLSFYLLSKAGYYRLSSYLFLGSYFLLANFLALQWDIGLPHAIVLYILTIIMAGILITPRASAMLTLLTTLSLLLIVHVHEVGMVKAQVDWSAKTAGYGDAFNLAVLYFLVMLISWLSTKEIERSLGRARRSEAALKKERDLLEIKVEERTRDLEKSQLEKISQLYRFAEYGKLTSGILHDLANPLSAISLNLEKMQGTEQSTLLKRALEGTKRMERFVELARKQIQNQKDLSVFSVAKEIQQSIKGLEYKAKLENVKLQFSKPNDITLYGSPMRFHQLISNLIGNAIDAYDHYETDHERVVIISYEFTGSKIYLRILDFGKGVSQEDNEKIFEPFFTTKTTDKGTGMGLSICKDIVEKDFHGKLQLISEKGKGTLFLVEIPIHHEPS